MGKNVQVDLKIDRHLNAHVCHISAYLFLITAQTAA